MEYIAFISYRHMPLSSAAAEKLAAQIEQFVIPKRLRRDGKRRLGRVFRDRDELPLSSDLGSDLYRALDQSEFLIVICTPEIMESRYCMEEVRYFLEKHDREHVLTVLASGTPDTSFPPVLRILTDPETGEERDVEPLAADITAATERESLQKLKREKFRLIAPMLGCSFDDLAQRIKRRRRRKALTAFAVICALAAAFTVFAVRMNQRNAAEQELRIRAEDEKIRKAAQLSVEQSRAYLEQGMSREALKAAADAFPQLPDGTTLVTPEGIRALSDAGRFYETGTLVPCGMLVCEDEVYAAELSADGMRLEVNGNTYDAVTLEHLPDGEAAWQIPEGESELMRDRTNDRILLDTRDRYVIRRLSDGEKLGEAEHGTLWKAENFATTHDGEYSFVLHHSPRGPYDGIYDAIGQTKTEAAILAFGPDGDFVSFDVPFDPDARMLPASHYVNYACRDGLYAIDPTCFISGHEREEAFFWYSFTENGLDASVKLVRTGRNAVLLFTGDSVWGFDGDTGLVNNRISLSESGVLGTVTACVWTREDESAAVFVTEAGQVWHYYDEHPGLDPANLTPFMPGRYSEIVKQDTVIHRADNVSCADGGPVMLAARSPDEPRTVRLYTYLRNPRSEEVSINRADFTVMDMETAPGYLLRCEGAEDGRFLYTLLFRGEGEPREIPFSVPSSARGIVGLSGDGKQAYSYWGVADLDTGEFRSLVERETGELLNSRRHNFAVCSRDSRGETLRMAIAQGTADTEAVMTAVVIRNDALTWKSAFPLEADAFIDSVIGDLTRLGKNGWAVTPVRKPDGTFAAVLTDLYGEKFTVLDDWEGFGQFNIGTDPDRPVLAQVREDRLYIRSCGDGSVAAEFPLPVPEDTLKDLCFVQNDRYILLAQTDLTTLVLDAADGTVLFRTIFPGAAMTKQHILPMHVYETKGEITVSYRNEGYRLYPAAYSVSTDSWKVIREIPRLCGMDYGTGAAVVLDGTLTRCWRIPILPTEEMLETAREEE